MVAELPFHRRLAALFAQQRFVFNHEKELQALIADLLTANGIAFQREVPLGVGNVLDFLLTDTNCALEVKISGGLDPILRQLKRYADLDAIRELILVCPRPFTLPATLSGKPLHGVAIFGSML